MTGLTWEAVAAGAGFLATVLFGIWRIFQVQFEHLEKEIERLRTELKESDKRKVGEPEFRQFAERVLAELALMRGQLTVLEQTRPTTGELEARIKPGI